MKILVVDDEVDLLEQLRRTLTSQRYEVDTASDGEEALEKLFQQPYDLAVLDIMLPGLDGLSILREIRAASIPTPVLLLSAKGEVEDRIAGLDCGADDYLAKPFAMAELLARIRSLMRRGGDSRSPMLSVADVALNTISREVRKGDDLLELTPKEFSILEFLLYNKGRVVNRYALAEHVWGDEFDPFTMSNFIDVHMKNLRKKTGDSEEHRIIHTVRGVGFIIRDTPK